MQYQKMLAALENLKKVVSSFYVYNEYGELPKLTDEDIYELNQAYLEVFKAASEYLNSVSEENAELEKSKMENADRIQEMLQKDIRVLQNTKPGITLPSAMKYANNRVIDVTGKTFKQMGDKCSKRQLMTITGPDGNPLKGLFTERTFVGFNPEHQTYYKEKLIRTYPEFAEMFEYGIPLIFSKPEGQRLMDVEDEKVINQFKNIKGFNEAHEALASVFFDLNFAAKKVNSFLSEYNPVSPIDTRNVALSNVAHLLGMDDKIAKSTTLTIRNNGNIIQGCFMEFAEGEDYQNPKKDGGIIKMNYESFDNSPVLKTLSDMQVLDYICGNTDRHAGNMFYKFDKNGKVIDVIGIDNDMSFGHMGKDLFSSNSGGLRPIFNISRSMYDRVMNLDEYLLLHSLDGLGLEQKNMDLTIERFRALREKINDGKVLIIEDKDYANYKMSDFRPKEFGEKKQFTYKDKTITLEKDVFFGITKNLIPLLNKIDIHRDEIKKSIEEKEKRGSDFKSKDSFEQLELVEEKNINVKDLEIGKDAPQILELNRLLERADKDIKDGSAQFTNIKTLLQQLENGTKLVCKNEKMLSVNNVNTIQRGYKTLLNNCKEYLKLNDSQGKAKKPSWTTSGRRIEAAKKVARFCEGRIHTLQISINNTMDKESLERAEIREMKDEAQALMIEGMSPKDVGQYVKSLLDMHSENPDEKLMTVKLGQQVAMCVEYMKAKDLELKEYELEPADISNAKALLKEGRMANAELKSKDGENIKDTEAKAAILM